VDRFVPPAFHTSAAFVHSPEIEQFAYPESCPFTTQRAGMTRKTLASMGLLGGAGRREVAPVAATREELETFHTPAYLEVLAAAEEGNLGIDGLEMGLGTGDTPIFFGLNAYVRLATGASLTAARLLLDGEVHTAFNPSGGYHHADPQRAAGFCYINDVAIACQALAAAGKRVLFLDVDVHHGDGVQRAFYDRADVMTISFHETGMFLFPGTGYPEEIGIGEGRGYSVNAPLPPETYDTAYLRAFDAIGPPLIDAFRPDVLVLELGLDTLSGDPLAHLSLTNNTHVEILHRVMSFDVPILMTGGGGYNTENTARGWALAWAVLCGEDRSDDLNVGLGGVMLETTDWLGGLRDREQPPTPEQKAEVDPRVDAVIAAVRRHVFPLHGLSRRVE
jgi:acetoin utilization protein AcuC